jgi:hypothetical protein
LHLAEFIVAEPQSHFGKLVLAVLPQTFCKNVAPKHDVKVLGDRPPEDILGVTPPSP